MIKSFIFIVIMGASALKFTDMQSDSAFFSVLLPFTVFFSALALAFWFVILFQKKGIKQNVSGKGGGGFSDFGGGDGGGDC